MDKVVEDHSVVRAEVKVRVVKLAGVGAVEAEEARTRVKYTLGIKLPDILTYHHSSRAAVTGFLENQLISVKSREHAHGRTPGCQRVMQINEIQADLEEMIKIIFNLFTTYFTVTSKKTK